MRKGKPYPAVLSILLIAAAAVAAPPQGEFHADRSLAGDLAAARQDCQVGSTDFASYQGWYDDFWRSDQQYAQLILPDQEGCACGEGVTIEAVHMYLKVNSFATLVCQAELWSAADDGTGCLAPGGPLAVSAPIGFGGFPGEGIADLAIPFNGPCMTPDEAYFVVFTYLDTSQGTFLGVPVDASPSACTQYIHTQDIAGWHDPVAENGWVGNYYVFADLACCSDPVADEQATWSGVKKTYR